MYNVKNDWSYGEIYNTFTIKATTITTKKKSEENLELFGWCDINVVEGNTVRHARGGP